MRSILITKEDAYNLIDSGAIADYKFFTGNISYCWFGLETTFVMDAINHKEWLETLLLRDITLLDSIRLLYLSGNIEAIYELLKN